jgi:predicted metal-dependent peptidase
MDIAKIETKLAAARTKLILDKPFLGALVLRLPMVAADPAWCKTTATDARQFYYNPEYIDSLSMGQTQFMLAHEALHCALSHFARRQHRIQHRWDLACDYAVNPLLMEDGLSAPPNMHFMPQYLGMTAEEIYPLIDENDETETLDQHMYDQENQTGGGQQDKPPKTQQDAEQRQGHRPEEGRDTHDRNEQGGDSPLDEHSDEREGDGAQPLQNEPGQGEGESPESPDDQEREGAPPPDPLTQQERETLEVQWQQRLAGAAQQAMLAGKLGGSMARLIDHLLQPQLPWRALLARYMSAMARDDFSYMRPSRREGDAILPSLKSSQIDIVVALDTSGSIKASEIEEFLSEVTALKGQMRARVTLLACDSELNAGAPWIVEPWEDFDIPAQLTGGGGTDFQPVFDWVDRHGAIPELLVYFTDAEGQFPEREPNYPVIWLVKGKEKVPWGQRVQLN